MDLTSCLCCSTIDPNEGSRLLDNGENNVHVLSTSSTGATSEIAEFTSADIRTNSDGTPGRMWVEYCSGILKVYLNKDGDTKPASPAVNIGYDLDNIFGPTITDLFAGYTAGTGSFADNHDIMSWSFAQTCSA